MCVFHLAERLCREETIHRKISTTDTHRSTFIKETVRVFYFDDENHSLKGWWWRGLLHRRLVRVGRLVVAARGRRHRRRLAIGGACEPRHRRVRSGRRSVPTRGRGIGSRRRICIWCVIRVVVGWIGPRCHGSRRVGTVRLHQVWRRKDSLLLPG